MKQLIFFLLIVFSTFAFTACEKDSSETTVSTEKKGGNGNGNSGGGSTPYTIVNTTPTNWNVTFDTSSCGVFILNWNVQPGATTYYVNVIERPWNCAGSAVSTNSWYYTYGYGCSMLVGHNYNIQLSYFIKDDVNKITTYYYSDATQVRTGSFAPAFNNCP